MKKVFTFDLDDTLLDNCHDYADPILDACKLIIKALGSRAPHVSVIMAMEEEIDKRRVREINPATGKLFLFSMERFPGSLVETYREICKRAKIVIEPRIEKELYEIGLTAFDESRYLKNIKSDALSTLDFLASMGDVLTLCSRGDTRVQDKKMAALKKAGIDHFKLIRIVNDKNPEVFIEILMSSGWSYGYQKYSVGNSYDSDIVSALSVGFKGIYIPVETWETMGKVEEINARVDRNRCFIFESLKQIQEKYEEISGAAII